jgi:DNA-binding MarR family transcriptional regulator
MTTSADLANEITTASAKLLRWLRAADPAPAMTGPQASALAVIIHSGRIRMSDLARLEEVSRPAITNTANQLEAQDLISREADQKDGRVSWLQATPKGRKLFANGQGRRVAPLAKAVAELGEADQATLLRACQILTRLLPAATGAR